MSLDLIPYDRLGEYRKPYYTGGHLIIGRTQLSDVASFRALQTRICESTCYEKAGDWPNKNRNFTVQN